MADDDCVLLTVDDGVAEITLNRPDKHNAFSPKQIDDLESIWRDLRMDAEVRAVIVTGAGDKAFSVGIDLSFEYPQPPSKLMLNDPMMRIGPKTNDVWKPVIGAVNGMACGGAFYILGEVEFMIAAEHATFFDPHVTHGMAAVYEPMLMLQRMPIGEVMRMALLGRHERISAARAHEIGLVQQVVPAADLMPTARQLARLIAANPDPLAVDVTVKAIWTAQQAGIQHALSTAPALLNLVDGTSAVGTRADALRRQKIEPNIR